MKIVEPNIRDILAKNIKENRRKLGLSQEKLAEKAGISTPFLAMIEVSRKFPTPGVLEKLAGALEIQKFLLDCAGKMSQNSMHNVRLYVAKLYKYLYEIGQSDSS